MRWWIKTLGCILSILVLLTSIGVFLPDHVYRKITVSVTKLATGRALLIGDMRVERGLNTVVELSDIAFANAQWSTEKHMLKAEKLMFSVNLPALLNGILKINSVSSSGLSLYLEKNSEGKANWQLSQSGTFKADLSRIKLTELSTDSTLIAYADHATSLQHTLDIQNLDFQWKTNELASVLSTTGKINDLPFQLTARSDDLDQAEKRFITESTKPIPFDVEASLDLPSLGPLDVSATIAGDLTALESDGLSVRNLELQLTDENLAVHALGALTGVPGDITGTVQVDINVTDNDGLLGLAGVDISLAGQSRANATLNVNDKRIDVELHQAVLNSDPINLLMKGELNDVLDSATAAIDIDVQAPDLRLITKLTGKEIPAEWGPLSLTGKLVGSQGQYALNKIMATLNGNSTARATGTIDSLWPFDNMHLDVETSLFTLREVSAFTKQPLPDIGPITGNGTVTWNSGKLSLVDAMATYKGPLGIAVVTGNIGDLVRFDRVRLRADADLPDFGALDLFTGFAMPPVDGVVISTNLISTQALDLSARNLKVTAQKDAISVNAEGSVDSIIRNKGILDLNLTAEVESISQLGALANTPLPDIGPVTATARLSGSKQDIELVDVTAAINDAQVSGNVSAQIGYLNRLNELIFDIDITTSSARDSLEKFGINLGSDAPATLSSQLLFYPETRSIKLIGTRLDIDGNTLIGDLDLLDITNPETPPHISGIIKVANWNLMELRDRPMGIRPMSEGPSSVKKTGMLLSNTSLPLAAIARSTVDLEVQIDQFSSTLIDVSNATLLVHSENGQLTVGPFAGMINAGQAEFQMMVDTLQTPPVVKVTAEIKEFDLARAGLFQTSQLVENTGGTTAMLNLEGRGESLTDIMASAHGEGGLYIEDLVLKQGALHILSSDFIDQLVEAITVSKEQSNQTRLMCTALTFQLNNGSLDTPMGFAVDSEKFAILGTAEINFQNEAINVMINSKPKRGLGLSLNRFVNLVEIGGRLATPQLSLSETGLLRLGASLAAAIASSGVTLLAEGLWELQQANSDVCAQALGK